MEIGKSQSQTEVCFPKKSDLWSWEGRDAGHYCYMLSPDVNLSLDKVSFYSIHQLVIV